MNEETKQAILNELLETLDREDESRPEGDEWFSLAEIANAKGWSLDKTRERTAKMVMNGILEKSRRYGLTKYYRLIKKP